MRGARVHAWGADPVLETLSEPEPAEGETLVAVAAASIAHIDLTVASGDFPHQPALPYVPSTEGAGVVLRSARFEEGAHVRIRGEGVGLWRDGLCAERAAVPDGAVFAVPAGVDLAVAAAFFSPCLTAYAALHAVGELQAGERVAITGASGAVGSVAVQLAARAGARVVAISRRPAYQGALPPGAQSVVCGEPRETAAAVRDAAGAPVDMLVDTVGGDLLPELILGAVRPGGRAVLVGYAAGERLVLPLPVLMAADVRLLPMNLIRRGPELGDVGADMLAAIGRGELQVPVTALPLERIGEALDRVRAGTADGRVVLLPGGA